MSKTEVERRIAEARNLAANEKRARKQSEHEQAEGERQKREDEKAWQRHAKVLVDAGKTESEIMIERKHDDAKRVANWLLSALGRQKFEEFRSELSTAMTDSATILRFIEDLDPAAIEATAATSTNEKPTTEAAVSEVGIASTAVAEH